MSPIICVICGSVWTSESDNRPDSDDIDLLGHGENLNILDALCTQLEVNLKLSDQIHFARSPLPFCFTCKDASTLVFQLQEQLLAIQVELSKTVESIKQQIDNSGENFERALESVAVTEWVKNLRAALGSRKCTKELKKRPAKSRVVRQESWEVKQEILSDDTATSDSGSGGGGSEYSDWTPSVDKEKGGKVKTSSSRRKNVQTNNMEIMVTDQSSSSSSSSSSENDSADDYNPKSKRSKKMKRNRASRAIEKKNRSISTRSDGTYEYGGYGFKAIVGGFECLECPNRQFVGKSGMLTHIRQIHLQDRPGHYCSICGKNCDSPSARRTHETTHTENQDHVCVECGKGFKNSKNLKRHLKETHKISIKFRCTTCLEQLRNAEELKKHLETAHSADQSNRSRELSNDVESRLCDNCGRIFKTAEARQTHEESHAGEKFFTCFYCKALYLRKENIKIHFEKDHGVRV